MAGLLSLVTILAYVGHSQGAGGSPPLPPTFSKATIGVAPLELDTAGLVRNFTASAVRAYLGELQTRLDFNEYNSAKATSQPTANLFKGVEHSVQNLEASATPTLFDEQLKGFAAVYRRLAALVEGRGDSGVAPVTRQTTPANVSTWQTLWTPEEAFIRMPDIVAPELRRLRHWVVDYVDASVEASIRDLPAMLSEYRRQILFPEVKSAQQTASTLEERYGETLKSHSSPGVWADYEEARRVLSATHLPSRR